VRLGLSARQVDSETEVGGMAGCSQNTTSLRGLVEWALVDCIKVLVGLENGLKPHHGAASVKNLILRLAKCTSLVIPSASLKVHAVDVNSLLRSRESVNVNDVVDDFEVQVHRVNGNLVLTRIVLKSASQETVSKEELVDPEVLRNLRISPSLEEIKALSQVLDVAGERLQTWVRFSHPKCWNFAIKHRVQSCFQVSRQQNLTLDSSLHVLQRLTNGLNQAIESDQLLSQHSVH